MALFSPSLKRGGLNQSFYCPRCREPLVEVSMASKGEGVSRRKVEAEYKCSCGYKIEVIESFPLIASDLSDQEVSV